MSEDKKLDTEIMFPEFYFEDLKPGLRYRNPIGRTVTDVDIRASLAL